MQNYRDRNFLREIDPDAAQEVVTTTEGKPPFRQEYGSFQGAVLQVIDQLNRPLKFFLPLSNIHFLYDSSWYRNYALKQDGFGFEELIEKFICDDLYRNLKSIDSSGEEIEPDNLWLKRENDMYLVDDDQYVRVDFDPNLFKIAE